MSLTETTYHGYTITLNIQAQQRREVCPWFIRELRQPCRDVAHAQQIIDGLSAAPAGGIHATVLTTQPRNLLTASACRNRAEQARAQDRAAGRWVKGGAA